MKSVHTRDGVQELVAEARKGGKTIGFVPTMGALHEGHLSLVRIARREAGCVVVSIFVNPTQFAPHEDFSAYPRTEEKDLSLLEPEGADIVFLPTAAELYPDGFGAALAPGPAAQGLETDFRPHFFGGVVNVVSRLFHAVKPDIAVFGEKDFQQLQVIREMVEKLHQPIKIIGGPIIRDEYGLALSSRNAYLNPEELLIARTLNRVLFDAADAMRKGGKAEDVCREARFRLLKNGFDNADYVEVRWDRILAAVWVGRTRLIDNVAIG
ncbi:MAG: pantoate--beta-alanine ligase [Alphaproteobacteria bacterium]|nr:pantoate--beta-alanine ligase [Alphaproteobacteria bacterium]